jgi:hypothetical protein
MTPTISFIVSSFFGRVNRVNTLFHRESGCIWPIWDIETTARKTFRGTRKKQFMTRGKIAAEIAEVTKEKVEPSREKSHPQIRG